MPAEIYFFVGQLEPTTKGVSGESISPDVSG